jgi:hypothetical protein
MPEGGFAHAVVHRASPDETTILEAVQRPTGGEVHSKESSCVGA